MKNLIKLLSCSLIFIFSISCSLFDKDEEDYKFPTAELSKVEDLSTFSKIFDNYLSIDFRNKVTIFAPSDQAFENLIKSYNVSTIDEFILRIGGEEYFKEVLEFHILPERKTLLEFSESQAYSINGLAMQLSYYNDTLRQIRNAFLGSSSIIQYNIPVHKGKSVVHKVNRVLRPNYGSFDRRDLIHEANRLGCSHFLTALALLDGMKETLFNLERTTIFIPTNLAFQRLMSSYKVNKMEDLIVKMGEQNFKEVLLYHVIPEVIWFPENNKDYIFTTINGKQIVIRRSFSFIYVYNERGFISSILSVDNSFVNGSFHVIDGVLLP